MNGAGDPGWRPALRPWWHFIVPWPMWWTRGRRLDLTAIRHVFVHLGAGLVEVCIAFQWIFDRVRPEVPMWAWAVGAALALWSVGGMLWAERVPIAAGPPDGLAARFRSRSFIELGFAAAPALYGIAGAEILGRPEPSWIGVIVSVLLLAWVAPRRARLDRIDADLRASGSTQTIRAALAAHS